MYSVTFYGYKYSITYKYKYGCNVWDVCMREESIFNKNSKRKEKLYFNYLNIRCSLSSCLPEIVNVPLIYLILSIKCVVVSVHSFSLQFFFILFYIFLLRRGFFVALGPAL